MTGPQCIPNVPMTILQCRHNPAAADWLNIITLNPIAFIINNISETPITNMCVTIIKLQVWLCILNNNRKLQKVFTPE